MRFAYLAAPLFVASLLTGCGFFTPSEPAPIPDCSSEAWTDASTDAAGDTSRTGTGSDQSSGGSSRGSSGAKAGCSDPRVKK